MAQKTEDPAVFTVDCECPQPGPRVPPGQPQPTQGPARCPEMLTILAAGVTLSLRPRAAHQPCLLPASEVILGVTRPEAPTPSRPVEGRGQASCAPWGWVGWVRWADTWPPPCSLTGLWLLKNLQNKPDLWAGALCICFSDLEPASGTFQASPSDPSPGSLPGTHPWAPRSSPPPAPAQGPATLSPIHRASHLCYLSQSLFRIYLTSFIYLFLDAPGLPCCMGFSLVAVQRLFSL